MANEKQQPGAFVKCGAFPDATDEADAAMLDFLRRGEGRFGGGCHTCQSGQKMGCPRVHLMHDEPSGFVRK